MEGTILKKDIIRSSFKDEFFDIALFHNLTDHKSKDLFLFVHGFPDSHTTWELQINSLHNKAFVACFDLRGTSDSQGPKSRKGYGITEVLKDFDLVINYLRTKNPNIQKIHLVGHDWGAILGWSYISHKAKSAKINSFTAMGGIHPSHMVKENFLKLLSFNFIKICQASQQFSHSWYVYFFQLPLLPEFSLTMFNNIIFRKALTMAQLPKSDSMWSWNSKKIDQAGRNAIQLYRELLVALPGLPDEPIEIPVKQYIFEYDAFVHPSSFDNQKDMLANYQEILFKANHWGHRTHSEQVNKELEKLIQS